MLGKDIYLLTNRASLILAPQVLAATKTPNFNESCNLVNLLQIKVKLTIMVTRTW